jgi:putative transposase
MSHSCVEIYIHVIFSTKNRFPSIPLDLESRLFPYLGSIAQEHRSPILKINGMADHVHMLLKLHATTSLAILLKELKAYSSAWVKKQNIKDFAWQEGYGGFSCSVTHLEALKNYITNQKEHHRTITLEEEIATLNRIWGVNWMADFKTDMTGQKSCVIESP